MIIEQISPKFVGDKASLNKCLLDEGKNRGLTIKEIDLLISSIPLKILNVDCFYDKLTEMWRYEFGLPFTVGNSQYLFSTHMWPPVKYLFSVLFTAIHKLPDRKRREYFTKLTNIDKHWDTLVEFLPIIRLSENTTFYYEVPTGIGNLNADWGITSNCGRMILIDVKRRIRDMLEVAERIEKGEQDPDGSAPAPTHDVSLMFRSIESKFTQNDPTRQLQGAWIETALKQEETELQNSFGALDGTKVHFAIFGGWKPGIKLLTKRTEDRQFLLDIFNESIGDNFHFNR